MALTATVYNIEISLADVDRGLYEDFTLRAARHPSESMAYLLTRLLAYALEYREGICFSRGLSQPDEPALWAHDLTGRVPLWVEVGHAKAERLHRASKLGAEVAVYLYKDPAIFLSQVAGQTIFRSEMIRIRSFSPTFLSELEPHVERRTQISLSVSEGRLYVTAEGAHLECAVGEHRLGA